MKAFHNTECIDMIKKRQTVATLINKWYLKQLEESSSVNFQTWLKYMYNGPLCPSRLRTFNFSKFFYHHHINTTRFPTQNTSTLISIKVKKFANKRGPVMFAHARLTIRLIARYLCDSLLYNVDNKFYKSLTLSEQTTCFVKNKFGAHTKFFSASRKEDGVKLLFCV